MNAIGDVLFLLSATITGILSGVATSKAEQYLGSGWWAVLVGSFVILLGAWVYGMIHKLHRDVSEKP